MIILYVLGGIIVFYILSRIFWKAGLDQIDYTLLKNLPKLKNNDNEAQKQF